MTIDEQIKALEFLEKSGIFPYSTKEPRGVVTEEYVNEAIDTMKKYQQIKEAVNNLDLSEGSTVARVKAYNIIKRVVNGNDN